jgi:spore germination protein GerM
MKKIFLILLPLLILSSVFGCAQAPGAKELSSKNQALQKKVSELEQQLKTAKEQAGNEQITLYFAKDTSADSYLVPEIRTVRSQPDMPKLAMEELIKGPADKSLKDLIPKNTKVNSVTVKDYIAYPDFSREITRLSVGGRDEALILASIADTLIKLPGIEKVQILIDGKRAETLAGHFDISKPIGRNETVLLLNTEAGA